jgi:hypothetical protein
VAENLAVLVVLIWEALVVWGKTVRVVVDPVALAAGDLEVLESVALAEQAVADRAEFVAAGCTRFTMRERPCAHAEDAIAEVRWRPPSHMAR